jgi:hypothetical protein
MYDWKYSRNRGSQLLSSRAAFWSALCYVMTEAEPTRETRQGVIHRDTMENVLRKCQFSEGVVFMRSGDK